jgi:hypothetical protein
VLWFAGGLLVGVVACGLVWFGVSRYITNLPNPTPSHAQTVPQTSPSLTLGADAGQPVCPAGIELPTGVDQSVCGGAPAGAIDPPQIINTDQGFDFSTPSDNMRCGWAEDGVVCSLLEYEFSSPKPADCDLGWDSSVTSLGSGVEVGLCSGERIGAWYQDEVPVMEYGQTFFYSQIACSLARDGLTCWNTETHHGFKLSRSAQLTW